MAQASPYTVLKLIRRSMRLLQVLNIGEPITPDEQQDGLEALNAMVDAWAILRLMIYTTFRQLVPLAASQPSYEIGPNAADWQMPRPTFIDGAGWLYNAGTPQEFERPMHIYTPQEWQRNRVKPLSSSETLALLYDAGFSNADTTGAADVGSGRVWVWPVPQGAGTLALYLPQAVQQFTSAQQTLALPPGYQRALAYNLALELAPEFDTTPSAIVIAIAQQSLLDIQRHNVQIEELSMPAGLHCRRGDAARRFDILIGD